MNPRINYTLVGGFVLLLSLAGLVLVGWLTQDSRNNQRLPYIVYFNDSVSGLNERAAVKYRGVPVGFVESIRLVTEPREMVKLVLRLDPETPVRTNTFATLQHQGITGLLFVELQSSGLDGQPLASSEANPVTIPGHASRLVEITDSVGEALQQFNNMTLSLNQLTQQLTQLTDSELKNQLLGTLAAIEKLSSTTERRLGALDTRPYEKLASELPGLLNRVEGNLSQQLQSLTDSLQQLGADTQGGLRQLTPLLQQAETLIEQFRLESGSWLRDNRTQPPGPGE